MNERDPQTPRGQALRAELGAARWTVVVGQADARAAVFDPVVAHQQRTGQSWRASAAATAPGLPWPTFVRWMGLVKLGDNPA